MVYRRSLLPRDPAARPRRPITHLQFASQTDDRINRLADVPTDCLNVIVSYLGSSSLRCLWITSSALRSCLSVTARLLGTSPLWYRELALIGATRESYGLVKNLVLVDQAYRQRDYELIDYLTSRGLDELVQARGGHCRYLGNGRKGYFELSCGRPRRASPRTICRALMLSDNQDEIKRVINSEFFDLAVRNDHLSQLILSYWGTLTQWSKCQLIEPLINWANVGVLRTLIEADPTLPTLIEQEIEEGTVICTGTNVETQRYLLTVVRLPISSLIDVEPTQYSELLLLCGYTPDDVIEAVYYISGGEKFSLRALVSLLDLGATINEQFASVVGGALYHYSQRSYLELEQRSAVEGLNQQSSRSVASNEGHVRKSS